MGVRIPPLAPHLPPAPTVTGDESNRASTADRPFTRTFPNDDAYRPRIRPVAAHADHRGAPRRGGEPPDRGVPPLPAAGLDSRLPQGQGAARTRAPGLRRRDRA